VEVKLNREGAVFRARRDGPGEVTVIGPEKGARSISVVGLPDGSFSVDTPTGRHHAEAIRDGETVWVHWRGRTYRFEMDRGRGRARDPGSGLASPMPGQVLKVLAAEGDKVAAHQPLIVVEAMKMQLEIKAPRAGRVKLILAAEGVQVAAGAPLAELEEVP
jgi:biotin carboxyl carrier protein